MVFNSPLTSAFLSAFKAANASPWQTDVPRITIIQSEEVMKHESNESRLIITAHLITSEIKQEL